MAAEYWNMFFDKHSNDRFCEHIQHDSLHAAVLDVEDMASLGIEHAYTLKVEGGKADVIDATKMQAMVDEMKAERRADERHERSLREPTS